MRSISHRIISANVTASAVMATTGSAMLSGTAFIMAWGSALLPDSAEYLVADIRWIRHRTLTHWLLPATVLNITMLLWMISDANLLTVSAFSIVSSYNVHLLCDMTTPHGVPIMLPLTRYNLSLKMVRNGWGELKMIFISLLMVIASCLRFY